jgi:hypothetical protein
MKPLGVALVIALSLAGAPEISEADGRRGGHGFRNSGRHHHHHRGHGHHHHRFHNHRPFFPVFVSPSVVVASPVVVAPAPVYAAPPVYAPAPAYAAPPYFGPPAAYAAPPAPPVPRVVEYPGGRYELRGDGVTSPYTWVWIPDPPAAPPPPPAPAAPPAAAPEPSLSLRAVLPRSTTYRWTDESGVTTWTDSLEKVPARFRAQAGQSAITR